MIERRGDLWTEDVEGWRPGTDSPPWLVITTNGETKSNGHAVMGAGVAKRAALIWPSLPALLGKKLKETGNQVYYLGVHTLHGLPGPAEQARLVRGVVAFPSKHRWRDASDKDLIAKSAEELVRLVDSCRTPPSVVILPRVGTLNGRLGWSVVKGVLEPRLVGDRYVVVSP